MVIRATALTSGEQGLSAEIYPGTRLAGAAPTRLELPLQVLAPVALPEMAELVDRRAIPDPQPDVMLHVAIEQTPDGAQTRLTLTCPHLGLDREPVDPPLELDASAARALRQATAGAAADDAGVRSFGALLFDTLMPAGHPLRDHFWAIRAGSLQAQWRWSWLIVSDRDVALPWELVRPYARIQDQVEHDDFLAESFDVTQWPGGEGLTLAPELPIARIDLAALRAAAGSARPVGRCPGRRGMGGEPRAGTARAAGALYVELRPAHPSRRWTLDRR